MLIILYKAMKHIQETKKITRKYFYPQLINKKNNNCCSLKKILNLLQIY